MVKDPLIDSAIVSGEGKPFLSALLVLNDDALLQLAKEANLALSDLEWLHSHS